MAEADERTAGAPIEARQREKYCRGCSRRLAVEDFSTKDRLKGSTHSRCRGCCREAARRHYEINRSAYLERNRRNQPRLKRAAAQLVYEFLREHPCTGCGESDILLLEFNHLDPSAKRAN